VSIRFKFALTVVALAAAASANATSFASASIGPIQIQLYDLDLTDSVLPSIVFSNANSSFTQAYATDGLGTVNYIWSPGSSTVGTASIIASTSGATASSLQGAQTSISGQASGGAGGAGGAGGVSASYWGYISSPYYSSFTLSANTAVRFSTVATLAVSTTVGTSPTASGAEFARAEVSFFANGYVDHYSQNSNASIYDYVGSNAGQKSFTETLHASLMNFSTSAMSGTVTAQTYISGNSNIAAAVPEPETSAMLLAGLGVIGAVARRRRARSL